MTAAASGCFHCGLNVPSHSHFSLEIDGKARAFCCPGCQAVASAIVSGGLENFYRFRTENNPRPNEQTANFAIYDLPEVQAEFVHSLETPSATTSAKTSDNESPALKQAQLLLEGISCAACVWLIEHHLAQLAGVERVRVNATTHRCLVNWNADVIRLSEIMAALSHIGYPPVPATEDQQQQLREKENRTALMRLAVAGFGMMQVGMVAVALYSGADAGWQVYLRWLSLLIATPVVFFSAKPFFVAAKRSLLARHLTMDVPVSIAIGGAYLASCWATVFGGGEVYFDSVSMFTFFLLWGRYLEMRARHRNGIDSDRMAQILPATAELQTSDGTWKTVPLRQLQVGDCVLVASGTSIPCDGRVLEGRSGVVETLLTGEPDAVEKLPGDEVIAGTLNTDSVLRVEVTAVGQGTRLSAIERLVEQAQQDKPTQVAMADRLAGYFVAAVLLVSCAVAFAWWQIDPGQAIWVTLSVLVVTCPCALSLASPAALTTAVAWLRQHGLLVTRGHVLEGLTQVQRVIFDKTGTLTVGSPQVVDVMDMAGQPLSEELRGQYLAQCAALETGSTHPIAKAFMPYGRGLTADHLQQITGAGVQGRWHGQQFRLGKADFVCPGAPLPERPGQWLLFGDAQGGLAWIRLQDRLRDTAAPLIAALQERNIEVELLSGDGESEVARVAAELGFAHWQSNQSPDQKLAYVQSLQGPSGEPHRAGEKVLMVGDGINDVPVLSGAFVSVAMGGASDLAQTRADSVLLGSDLMALERAFQCAHLTRKIIRQNLSWALGYNVIALPLAALGMVPPWAAAIGMSTSSLVVVANALRIGRK
ncbi:cadmium-translocating P-type ATPase [Aestuariicella hydrocarbonica]|uniref:Cadmium-translocating P-type ATPase n=1 Tax=Pseudomaricurvus hydrocarbonicus TaxID=1470433 RepID=A0A9E5JT40_9GAMM|nr:cadmium-translocating P-type ATPase [Aestuariicella hydrocarbonica]